MHISLDSALGRQKRLNSVGESVLQIAPDAAAAYSLRSLTGGDPDVVRVRRESDNTEKDFSGSQIESGEMARWVNEQPTLPLDLRELDTNTGERDGALIEAAAAYSLRNLSSSFTGDVVEVRRSSDTAKEGFTAAEVTDGTLEAWVSSDAPISPIADLNVDITDHTTGDTGTYSFGASDILVDGATGNDSTGDGSESSPYATIAKGLAEITSGNTVWVKGGTYAENTVGGYLLVNNLSFAAETTLRAVPSETVVLTNVSGSYIFRTNTIIDNFTFRGITFRNESPVTYSIYLSKDSNNFKIQDCRFEAQGSVTYAIQDRGSVSGSTSTTITNTAFTGAIQGIQALNTVGITLTDNYFETSKSGPTFANLRSGCGGTISITGNRLNGQIGTSGDSFDVAGTSLEISDNRINISYNNQDAINVRGGTLTNPITIDLQDNLIEAQDAGVLFYSYISSGTISGNKIHAGKNQVGGRTGLGIPVDGVTPITALVQSLTVTSNEVRSDNGHAFLMSLNSANHTVTNNKFDASQGGDHACVIKGDGHTLTGNKSLGGTRTTYYLKGATNITTTNHVGVQSVASGNCIEVSPDNSTTPDTVTSDCSTTGSTFIATNGDLYTISPSDLTAANVVFNSNCLIVKDSGSWGSLNGTTVTSLATVKTAWDSYITTNDENSYDTVNGTVSTWYDQSGNTNDATQTDPTKQPKIVVNGNPVTENGKPAVDFDQTEDQELSVAASTNFNNGAIFSVSRLDGGSSLYFKTVINFNDGDTRQNSFGLRATSGNDDQLVAEKKVNGVNTRATESGSGAELQQLGTVEATSTALNLYVDGTQVASTSFTNANSNPTNITIGLQGPYSTTVAGTGWAGTIQEIIAYDSDQSDNRTAIEANIGETYGITAIPAANDAVNGYVQTWYDQSGSGNDAVQSAAANQPKIVGEVTSGQPHAFLGALDFDGSSSFMVASGFAFSPSGDMLISSVQKLSTGQVYDARDGGADGIFVQQGGSDLRFRYNSDGSVDASGNNDLSLATFEIDGTTMTVYKNGSSAGTDTVVAGLSTTTDFHIGRNSFSLSNYADGKIYEIVAYESDQSDNRTAIEANINNQYDIY